MKIIYKCSCMLKEREIVVTDRVPDDDIAEWMETVVVASISYDHRARNALCMKSAMEFVKIPIDADGGQIGTQKITN